MQLSDEEMAEVIEVEDYRQQLNKVTEKLKKDYVENLSIRSAVGMYKTNFLTACDL